MLKVKNIINESIIKLNKFIGINLVSDFQAGDKVTAFGNSGTVKCISKNGLFVEVKFEDCESVITFYLDGKYSQWHKESSLRKI